MKSLKWKTVCFNVEANRNTKFHFQMESWLTSSHFLHSRRKTLTQDVVVLQFIWSNFQLLKNQALMLTLMNLVLLIMKKKAAQSFPVCQFFSCSSISKDILLFWEVILLQTIVCWEEARELIDTAFSNIRFACVHNKPGLDHEMVILFNVTWGLRTFIPWLRPHQGPYHALRS